MSPHFVLLSIMGDFEQDFYQSGYYTDGQEEIYGYDPTYMNPEYDNV